MPAQSVFLASRNENKVHLARLQLCYRTQSAPVVRSPRQQGRLDAMSLSKSYELQPEDFCKLSDEELMQHVTSGHHDALAILFERYHRLVFDVAVRIVRDPGEAEEVVQTVFLDIFRAMANFDSRKGILKVWILQYAYHRALHRKRHLASNHFYRWEELEAAIEVGSGRALWGGLPETARLAEEMLGNLKSRQRAVIEMTYYEGLTAEEIACRLGESPHVVRHDLHRGLAALRAKFGNSHEKE
jgi:RNA polymerase sigma-70 factor (ECF subfamily)